MKDIILEWAFHLLSGLRSVETDCISWLPCNTLPKDCFISYFLFPKTLIHFLSCIILFDMESVGSVLPTSPQCTLRYTQCSTAQIWSVFITQSTNRCIIPTSLQGVGSRREGGGWEEGESREMRRGDGGPMGLLQPGWKKVIDSAPSFVFTVSLRTPADGKEKQIGEGGVERRETCNVSFLPSQDR